MAGEKKGSFTVNIIHHFLGARNWVSIKGCQEETIGYALKKELKTNNYKCYGVQEVTLTGLEIREDFLEGVSEFES